MEQIENYAEQIESLMDNSNKFIAASNLTLPRLAKRIGVSPQIASEIINRHFHLSFADFINSYRLKDAKKMLQDEQNFDKKIVAIAFECGYGTLSGI